MTPGSQPKPSQAVFARDSGGTCSSSVILAEGGCRRARAQRRCEAGLCQPGIATGLTGRVGRASGGLRIGSRQVKCSYFLFHSEPKRK